MNLAMVGTLEKWAEWVAAQRQSPCLSYSGYWFRFFTLKNRVAKARRYFGVKLLRVLKGTGQ